MTELNAEPHVELCTENNFEIVKQLRVELNNIFTEIDGKTKILNDIYGELVKTHQDKNYTIGLDSFHFQNKLIQLEYDNMKNVFNFIDNRVYCEYYKLHRMLFEFIGKDVKDKTIVDKLLITHKKYPIYKDLEPMKIYDFNITVEINNTIHNAIEALKEYLSAQKEELKEKQKRSAMGINIHSIIHEQVYNNIILEERIHMFENYLNTFISHHSKYFSRLTIKLKLMLGIVNEDFHLKKNKVPGTKGSKKDMKILCFNDVSAPNSADDSSDSSSLSSTLSTPKSSMNDLEEINVRMLIGDTNSNELESELNTILQHIPQTEEETSLRRTVKNLEGV
jgi:hypothetical protein